jgi:hypothetical protein
VQESVPASQNQFATHLIVDRKTKEDMIESP